MWKDFFNFSKRERITIIALTLLIILVQLLIWTKDSWVKFLPENMEKKYEEKKELEAFRDSVTAQKPTYATKQRSYKSSQTPVPLKRVPFNPNTADSMTLRGLGLRAYVVKNILNYRRKGGSFRKPADFSRIYGLEPDVFAELEPFIQMEGQNAGDGKMVQGANAFNRTAAASDFRNNLPTDKIAPASTNKTIDTDKQGVSTNKPNETDKQNMSSNKPTEAPAASCTASTASLCPTFDLNTADTSLLQQLKGVGSFTANRISRYRNQLGGFYSLSQLSEIKGLYPETLARLQSMMKIDPSRIQTLDVNKASLEKLRAHPYLSFYQAKVIVELRKARGKVLSIEALKTFKEFTTEDLERLKWYLRF